MHTLPWPSRVILVVALFLAPGTVRAGEEDEAPPQPPVAEEEAPRGHAEARKAYAWLETTRAFQTELRMPLQRLREAGMPDTDMELYRKVARELYRIGSSVVEPAEEAFREAFERSDWQAWNPEQDEALLAQGLDMAARHALAQDPVEAVAAWDRLVEALPEHTLAERARTTWLPIALPSTGDLERARQRLASMAAAADAKDGPGLWMSVGDVLAMEGEYPGAQALYQRAMDAIPEDADPKRDPLGRLKGYLALRQKLIGQPARALGEATFLAGVPRTLESLRGQVVLIDFWATWCGPCLKGIPGIQALHERYADKGLQVLGVTRLYAKRGVLPEKPADERGPALPKELYTGETMEQYIAHLEAFRGRVHVTYPFVIVESSVMGTDYGVTGIPTMVVIDPDGKVGFVAIGGMREHLLRIAIERRVPDSGGR